MEKLLIADDDDELRKVESMANDELQRDIIREIEKENRLVKIYTYYEYREYNK
jgi:adenylate kinase